MAKELEMEKIELKVSVNCCDGCKRKVKKALQSIEGVLKIEVDSLQPKVTVLGNVDPQVLTKRLSKVGKQAEVRRHWNQNGAAMGNKGDTMPLPCYAVPSYALAAAAAPLPQTCCSQEYFHCQPPLFNTPTTRVGDYFSDENTLGCSVM